VEGEGEDIKPVLILAAVAEQVDLEQGLHLLVQAHNIQYQLVVVVH
jgi:hypothetical protein